MKQVVFGIFAHPDDEAFLPSGTLILYAKNGAFVHLVCATRGENGENPDNETDLGAVREAEWRKAGKLMGVCEQKQLGYPDGGLNNNLFEKIYAEVEQFVKTILKRYKEPVKITFLTYDNCGVTGHLDHIAMSFITTKLFVNLNDELLGMHSLEPLRYACLCEAGAPQNDTSFVFMPKGQTHDCIDETEDVSSVLELKKQVMRAHHSQRQDAEAIIKQMGKNLAYEHFCTFRP